MHIAHVALWTDQLEVMRLFYEEHFLATASEKYVNPKKNFNSYFLSFASGAQLELMEQPGKAQSDQAVLGYAHIAIALGSEAAVDAKTEELRQAGYQKLDGPVSPATVFTKALLPTPMVMR